jgi:predicted SAM-dependent methyltransferase
MCGGHGEVELAEADICFSVGLIEHFTEEDLPRVVSAHFDVVRPGGLVVISFPTPTCSRSTRW